MMRDFENAVEAKAAEVGAVNGWQTNAVVAVASAMMAADDGLHPMKAMQGATVFVSESIKAQLEGRNIFRRALPPAVLGQALVGPYGDKLLEALTKSAGDMAGSVARKRAVLNDEYRRKNGVDAYVETKAPVVPQVDLGAYARDSVMRNSIEAFQKAAPTSQSDTAFIDPDRDVGMVRAAEERTLAQAHPSLSKYPAKRGKR
jgi:hypothetical protein